jgi:Leucine-rich repeat (LRR) protein
MASIQGDQFIRTLAHYLRANEHKLATPRTPPKETFNGVGVSNPNAQRNVLSTTVGAVTSLFAGVQSPSPRRPAGNIHKSDSPPASIYGVPTQYLPFYPTSRPQSPSNSTTLTLDPHHLYFLLVQFEHIGLDIGDPALLGSIPDGGVVETETSATENKSPSIMSIASNISTISLSTGWNLWERRSRHQESQHSIEDEITFIYKVLSRITAVKLHFNLSVHPQSGAARTGRRVIVGYEAPLPQDGKTLRLSAVPFRSLTHLELVNMHPCMIDGWIALQGQLSTLIIKGARVEDINEVIVEEIAASLQKRGQVVLREDDEDVIDLEQHLEGQPWHQLKHLSLADNSITTLDNAPLHYIQKLEHFDISSNLLIDIPNSLTSLYNLRSLNLAHNMISSVTGVNTILGNVQELDLRGNRLTILAGLERLWSLERLDIRNNRLEETAEIGRLATLPAIKEVWVEGNPFTLHEVRAKAEAKRRQCMLRALY